tara:strand:+ start:310 stop:549 length:240 start_codon:yes stop_codon:yes gene_type:complete
MKFTRTLIITPNFSSQTVNFDHGMIQVSDDSGQNVTISLNQDALNDAIAKRLTSCSRSTQEIFSQLLTEHIRKTDNAKA